MLAGEDIVLFYNYNSFANKGKGTLLSFLKPFVKFQCPEPELFFP